MHDLGSFIPLAKIGKEANLSAMSVQVEEPVNAILSFQDILQVTPYLRALARIQDLKLFPTSIEVIPQQISPWVAVNNTIHIDHRDYIKAKFLPIS